MNDPTGRIIVSLILGFGLAALFRQVCKGDECHIVEPPNLQDLKKYYYKVDGDCYKYTPYATKCDSHDEEKKQ